MSESASSTTVYNYKVVKQFTVMTVVWGIVGMLVGAANVNPDASSTELSLNGSPIADSSANVYSDTQMGITLRYM